MKFVNESNAKQVATLMNDLYEEAYDARDEVEWYDRGMYAWDLLFYTESPLIGAVVRERGDVISSDRECAAFGEAVTRIAYDL